jgi:CHAT domain-containing protein
MGDPENLARAFLQAGVPQVVASRWNVDSASTVKFMDSFYGALLSGKPVTQSVKEAGSLVRSLPGKNRPYYWAAFSAFGQS